MKNILRLHLRNTEKIFNPELCIRENEYNTDKVETKFSILVIHPFNVDVLRFSVRCALNNNYFENCYC